MGTRSAKHNKDIVLNVSPLFRLHKGGRMERLGVVPPIAPSFDPKTGVESKDINIFSELDKNTMVSLRLFKPKLQSSKSKVPILFYFHGGGFCIESTFSPKYHNFLNSLASEAQVLIVSVEYRRVPEHPLPAAYHDCWDALNWAASHAPNNNTVTNNYNTKEPWLQEHVDFARVYLGGDSAGGNIAHHLALRIGTEGSFWRINGIFLVHPFFWGNDRIGDEAKKCSSLSVPDLAGRVWALACPASTNGADHPWIHPANDPRLSSLGCKRVLVFIAEKDFLRDRGLLYKETLEKSGWQGNVEVVESLGEDHVFHLLNPTSQNSVHLMRKIVAFLNTAPSKL